MPNTQMETLPKNNVKLTITLTNDELRPHLEAAAQRLSEKAPVPGFRPGHAPYDMVKQRLGEMKIYEEALESAVRSSFVKAVLERKIETVGSPHIDIVKLAPGNDLVFTAEVARMPSVTRMADLKALTVKKQEPEVKEADMENALKDLTRMQTKEVRAVSGTTTTGSDKVVLAMDMKKGNVSVEGGSSSNHGIYLAEKYYIPGFKEQLMGMKEGESKVFTLPFPKEHVQKSLAGADIEFHITLNELYHLESPALDDTFAVHLGQKNLATLKALLHQNLLAEKQEEERLRFEKQLLETIAEDSRFEEIPDLLLNEEINKMIGELQAHVESQGLEFATYLKNLNRTLADLKMDFTPQALLRIKVALVLQVIAKQDGIEVPEKDIDEAVDRMAERYEDVDKGAYREYVRVMLRNRKTIEHVKSTYAK